MRLIVTENMDFLNIYNEIKNNINNALTDIQKINIKNEKGNAHLEKLKNDFMELNNKFNDEINYLEANSEWEKFTIAFFGETNAGKSTILESLRIIFKEKRRQEIIHNNSITTEQLEEKFSENCDVLFYNLDEMYKYNNHQIKTFANDISKLAELYQADKIKLWKTISIVSVGFFAFIFCITLRKLW